MDHKYPTKFDKAKHKVMHLARNSHCSGTREQLCRKGPGVLAGSELSAHKPAGYMAACFSVEVF